METELPPDSTPTPAPESKVASEPSPTINPAAGFASNPVTDLMSTNALTIEPVLYRDRSTGLVIFGVAQIILGLLAALMVPLIGLSAFLSRRVPGAAARPGQLISSAAVYLFSAAILIALGIGSLQAKRWARALTLVISWYWLIGGFLVTILLTAVLPVMMRGVLRALQNAAGPAGNVSTGVMAVILTVIILLCGFFAVVVPLVFVVFYSRKDVGETCRRRDPGPSWTDRAPLPVLGASVVLGVGALYSLVVGATTPMFPFFGRYVTGLAGATDMVALAALDAYIAVALFRLKATAWWLATVTTGIRLLSLFLTFTRADILQAYSKIGWSDQQLKMMSGNPIFRSHVILWWALVSLCLFFSYLIWLRRYFKAPTAPPQTEPLPVQAS